MTVEGRRKGLASLTLSLAEAIQAGDVELIGELLDATDLQIDEPVFNGLTVLILALRHQQIKVVEFALGQGARTNLLSSLEPWNPAVVGGSPKTGYPLQAAVQVQNADLLQLLLDHGARPSECLEGVQGLIYLAVKLRHPKLVERLIQMNREDDMCTISAVDMSEALFVAVKQQDLHMVQVLVRCGANVNRECNGVVPLVVAANNRDLRMCLALRNAGASLDLAGGSLGTTQTPLGMAIWAGMNQAIVILLLLGCSARGTISWSLSSMPGQSHLTLLPGSSMLHFAVVKRNVTIASTLLMYGATLDQVDSEGRSPLHLACSDTASVAMIKYFLQLQPKVPSCNGHCKATVDINAKNSKGHTPLMVSIITENVEAFQLLLNAGADCSIRSHDKATALHFAIEKDNEAAVLALLKAGASPNGSMTSAGMTPLHLAVMLGKYILIDILLEAGADPQMLTSKRQSCLHLAISWQAEEHVAMFLQKGLDVNARSSSRDTPLMLACRQNNVRVCELLIINGALLNLRDKSLETSLSLSVYFGFEDNALLLIVHGADLNMADKRKNTPIYWSIFNCRMKVLRYLLIAGASFTKKQMRSYPFNLSIWRDQGNLDWMQCILDNPRTLQDMCRVTIRRVLVDKAHGRSIQPYIHQLLLPAKLQQYLMYSELHELTEGQSESS